MGGTSSDSHDGEGWIATSTTPPPHFWWTTAFHKPDFLFLRSLTAPCSQVDEQLQFQRVVSELPISLLPTYPHIYRWVAQNWGQQSLLPPFYFKIRLHDLARNAKGGGCFKWNLTGSATKWSLKTRELSHLKHFEVQKDIFLPSLLISANKQRTSRFTACIRQMDNIARLAKIPNKVTDFFPPPIVTDNCFLGQSSD